MSRCKDQRFLPYHSDLNPQEYSKSDFCYAVAPVCSVYMMQTGQNQEPFAHYASEFFYNVWPYPHSVWARHRKEMRLKLQWDFMQDLCCEIRFYEARVQDGAAEREYEGTTESWEDLFREALQKSNFEKWADDSYALANALPQILDPRARSEVNEKMTAAFLGRGEVDVDCRLLISFRSLCC